MSKSSACPVIRLRGVRHNNLKNFDLDLPLNQLIVITGLSGSGKSSLAFDTLFAEGQRRYIETFSPYARQFFDRMDKPRVDSIEGIPPAIAIEQRNAVRTTRSTVGTMTEICDYLKALWPHIARLHCRQCGEPVRRETPAQVWEASSKLETRDPKLECLVTFDLALSDKLSLEESFALVARQGYQRLLIDGEIVRLDDPAFRTQRLAPRASRLTVIQDRLRPDSKNRPRFIEACEQAYHFGKGKLQVWPIYPPSTIHHPLPFSSLLHCAKCDIEYREPTPALFSFNHPVGACPACKGFGRIISIDYSLAIPDRSLTLAEGAVKPWRTGFSAECQGDLAKFCKARRVPMNVPFAELSGEHQSWVTEGDPDYGSDEEHEWPRAWYGVKGYFRWLETKSYKMHVRVLLSRYRAYTTCPECQGARFQPETLLYRWAMGDGRSARELPRARTGPEGAPVANRESEMTLADFYSLPIRDASALIESMVQSRFTPHASRADPVELVMSEVRSRLGYLNEVGLGYLTLDRSTRSLSRGETERVNLTTCLGTRLVNTLFVLDEPSVGLHPRDTERLVRILRQLRDAGNTVVVVEHEASVMRAANQIVDLGPGHGATGGQVVFQGAFAGILKARDSLTGQYLGGRRQIVVPDRRPVVGPPAARTASARPIRGSAPKELVLHDSPVPIARAGQACPMLTLTHATRHNLRDVTVQIPLNRFVCLTGVSGSGKTTLVREILLPALEARLGSPKGGEQASEVANENPEDNLSLPTPDLRPPTSDLRPPTPVLSGGDGLGRVVLVDQSTLGKTPRSNPAVYIGAFDDIRDCFAQSDLARRLGLNASAFSFNSAQGQCERCRGAGYEKIEMQFLSDVFIRCPDCDGRRYRQHILQVKVRGPKVRGSRCQVPGGGKKLVDLTRGTSHLEPGWSIADVLDATVDEVIDFLGSLPDSRPGRRAIASLRLLQEVGLGYLRLGQPINTLSGGESQRLKLVRHLAEATTANPKSEIRDPKEIRTAKPEKAQPGFSPRAAVSGLPSDFEFRVSDFKATLFLFDEPTTGLHFDDVRVLLKVFQRLVDAGHSVLVIEHNLDVIKSADWVIDLGPEAGDGGGRVVAVGTPEQVAGCGESHTGRALKAVLKP